MFNIQQNERTYRMKGASIEGATTCLRYLIISIIQRWRPQADNKSNNILVSGNSDGSVVHWHAPSGIINYLFFKEKNYTSYKSLTTAFFA